MRTWRTRRSARACSTTRRRSTSTRSSTSATRPCDELMTPRSQIFFLPPTSPVRDACAELQPHPPHQGPGLRRTPGQRRRASSTPGTCWAPDLGQNLQDDRRASSRDLLREPYFVPETKSVADLFHTFRKRKLSLALTVDEYGGVTGLVTMEDLLECIFGDIPSPSDTLQDEHRKRPWSTDAPRSTAAMSIAQFSQELDVQSGRLRVRDHRRAPAARVRRVAGRGRKRRAARRWSLACDGGRQSHPHPVC